MWPFDQNKRRLKKVAMQLEEHRLSLERQQGLLHRQQVLLERREHSLERQQQSIERQEHSLEMQQHSMSSLGEIGRNNLSALSHLVGIQQRLDERLEFCRREILFEIQYGGGWRREGASNSVSWQIIAQEKYNADIAEGLRINLGCGHISLPDYINIDSRALPGVDIVADVADLKLPQGSVREIFSAHLLEHFPQEQLERALLPHWKQLMGTGGMFRAIVPDGEAMALALSRGEMCYEDFREVLFGAQDYTGDFHFNMFTPESLTRLLRQAGFKDINVLDRARRNGKCFEFEIIAQV